MTITPTTSRLSRRHFAGLGAAGTAALLAACGRSEEDKSGSSAAAEPVAEGPATGSLTVWAMGAEGEALPELLKGFEEENPDVSIKVTPIPWDSAHDKFTSAIAAGTAPDVAQVGSTWMAEFVGLNALEPTPDLLETDDYFPGALDSVTVDDVVYGVPWYVETRLVFYRKDIAEQVGVTEPPTDWEGLFEMARALQGGPDGTWGIALQPGGDGSWQTVLPLCWSNGGDVVSEDGGEFTFETSQNEEALAYYQSYFTEGISDPSPAEGTTEQDFVSGAVPMFISGPWMMAAVEDLGGEGFADKYGVFVMPEKESSASFLGGANIGVFQGTKNRDGAWKLVEYLSRPEVQVEWFTQVTDLPALQSAWEDEAVSANEKFEAFRTQLQSAFAPPTIATWEQVAARFDAQIEQVCKQDLAPKDALATTQSEAQGMGTGG
ncbi:extracellular solute-binding protein [Brachybacterium sp. JB7]|uniref:sugar ABC transporter substrate-binding protein n=1 Tax=Brachybacterium TaxID=43668 RepID=UPI000DF2F7AD|nr:MULTISPECIES: sugar ABC transporter substrate-binding protein [Brachybacterium]RCS64641.1 extracellular solute-binding protein [Brachybacterium sp. JB7]RCS65454.1 extracellular solute-binding protein [Brachybacterium alimentarium]RCS84107.1 extracellular solute-binding protein [Brachybacterium alimentarium]RCS86551.1 extracellular solute-binding protein [Brachybacterium alimentarium]